LIFALFIMSLDRSYEAFLHSLDDAYRGNSQEGLEKSIQKGFYILSSPGIKVSRKAELDTSNEAVYQMKQFCDLKNHRRKIEIAGVKREMAPETEILESLQASQWLLENLVFPYFKKPVELVSTLVHENANLGLGYANSITQSAAEGYIAIEDRYTAKQDAVAIARAGLDLQRGYCPEDPNALRRLKKLFPQMVSSMKWANPDLLRPFEANFTKPKNIIHKNQAIDSVCDQIVNDGYFPDFVVPIAHGGMELGLLFDLRCRDLGKKLLTYPILFSIKTRRHSAPLTEGDEPFLKTLPKSKTLITEDWITTGNTFRGVWSELERNFPDDLRVATIKQDPRSGEVPLLQRLKIYAGQVTPYTGSKTDSVSPKQKD